MESPALNPYFDEIAVAVDAPMTPTSNPGDIELRRPFEKASSTVSEKAEKDDLKEAAEHSLNVILHLNLDGTIRWVSLSWEDVIGSPRDSVQGKPISDILVGEQNAFTQAMDVMKNDDSRSYRLRFAAAMGPKSKLARDALEVEEDELTGREEDKQSERFLNLEGQGILIYDRESGELSHTMWVIHPYTPMATATVNLPPVLVDSLGVGATMLAQYLKTLAENGMTDPESNPPPVPVLCRICERQIPPWWFEKHSDLCYLEHQAESTVQMAQERLGILRSSIVKILDAMERQPARTVTPDAVPSVTIPEYRGFPLAPVPSPSAGINSPHTPPRSRESSASGSRLSREFRQPRPRVRIVELLLDLCDTAMEISTPMIKEPPLGTIEIGFRTQSPESEARISQVLQWQKPTTNLTDQERGLALLCEDTEKLAKDKVDAVLRHRHTIEFSERLRLEFSMLVQDCIDEALRKAALTVEPVGMDDYSGESDMDDESEYFPPSYTGPSATEHLHPQASDASLRGRLRRLSSGGDPSSASVSPGHCTPRSERSRVRRAPSRRTSRYASRTSMHFEPENGDSDTSGKSSLLAAGISRTDSPLSDHELTAARLNAVAKDRKRTSMYQSHSRQASPARSGPISASPLRISKPRMSIYDTIPTPITSPLLSSDFSPASGENYHHRRQSSVASSDQIIRAPVSPRLSTVNPTQPRAVAPSIKDFEIIKPISKGAFGSVYLSKKKSTGDYFAIKVLKKSDMIAKNQVTNVRAERAIMMVQGESDFVAKLFWTFASKDYLYLVMEYMNGGDCAALVKALGDLPEDWAKRYVAEVVLGLENLHGRGIVHRDLKPDNLLIDQKGHLKLTDFGLSRMGLLGRQKRARNQTTDSTPDLLKQGPFPHANSNTTSSRSTSFDFPGTSPSSTPMITPDHSAQLIAPSYFSLNREGTLSRDNSRRASNPKVESSSEGLASMLGNMSMNDSMMSSSSRKQAHEDDSQSEMSVGSYDHAGYVFSGNSATSGSGQMSSNQTIMPPAMALFDPEDSSRKFVGTPDYLAPETIRGSGQDEMSDWWSLGCILFEFLYGYPPFNADTHDEVFENILNRRINWPDSEEFPVSPEARDLMERLMCTDQTTRLGANGAEEVKSHPWFADINWDTLLEEEPSFIPAPAHPEDTDYFDSRGANLKTFEEFEEQGQPSPVPTPGADYPDRPHDAISRVRSGGSGKRSLVPLSIPAHVREGSRNRRLSEPVGPDDFGSFAFKNLPVLEKANKDVIQRLKTEAMKNPSASASSSPSSPNDSSLLQNKPLTRALSTSSKGSSKRPTSPSHPGNASSAKGSQPSSPLMVSFSNSPNEEKRKSTPSLLQSASVGAIPSGTNFMDIPKLSMASMRASAMNSAASSPVRHQPSKLQCSPIGLGPAASLSTSPVTSHPKQFRDRSSTKNSMDQNVPPSQEDLGLQLDKTSGICRTRSLTVGSGDFEKAGLLENWKRNNRRSQVIDMSPSSSDNEEIRTSALLRVQKRRQSSRRMSSISLSEGPVFRPLDILVCEDHPVTKMVTERLLEKLKCRTITVENGADAVRVAMSEIKFDIILMEFKLPQINGEDVARMIRTTENANSRTPIVAVTGYLKDLIEPDHFDALLEKPITSTSLCEILEKFCMWKPPPLERTSPSDRKDAFSPPKSNLGRVSPAVEKFLSTRRNTTLGHVFPFEYDASPAPSETASISRMTTNEWDESAIESGDTPKEEFGKPLYNPFPSTASTSSQSLAPHEPPRIITHRAKESLNYFSKPTLNLTLSSPIATSPEKVKEETAPTTHTRRFFWSRNKSEKQDEDRDKDKEKEKEKDKEKEKEKDNEKEKEKEEEHKFPERIDSLMVPGTSPESDRGIEKKPSKAKSIADFVMRAGKRTSSEMKRSKSDRGDDKLP